MSPLSAATDITSVSNPILLPRPLFQNLTYPLRPSSHKGLKISMKSSLTDPQPSAESVLFFPSKPSSANAHYLAQERFLPLSALSMEIPRGDFSWRNLSVHQDLFNKSLLEVSARKTFAPTDAFVYFFFLSDSENLLWLSPFLPVTRKLRAKLQ